MNSSEVVALSCVSTIFVMLTLFNMYKINFAVLGISAIFAVALISETIYIFLNPLFFDIYANGKFYMILFGATASPVCEETVRLCFLFSASNLITPKGILRFGLSYGISERILKVIPYIIYYLLNQNTTTLTQQLGINTNLSLVILAQYVISAFITINSHVIYSVLTALSLKSKIKSFWIIAVGFHITHNTFFSYYKLSDGQDVVIKLIYLVILVYLANVLYSRLSVSVS